MNQVNISFDTPDEFLSYLKSNGITYKKLNDSLFGKTAIRVIKLIREDDTNFYRVNKNHQLWWTVLHAIEHCEE